MNIADELALLTRAKESTENRIHYLSLYKHSAPKDHKREKQTDLQNYILSLIEKREAELNCDIAMIPYEEESHV